MTHQFPFYFKDCNAIWFVNTYLISEALDDLIDLLRVYVNLCCGLHSFVELSSYVLCAGSSNDVQVSFAKKIRLAHENYRDIDCKDDTEHLHNIEWHICFLLPKKASINTAKTNVPFVCTYLSWSIGNWP